MGVDFLFICFVAFGFPCSLPSDVMKDIFAVGARSSDGWEFLLKMYFSSVSEAEKSKMIEALASTEDARKLIWYEGAIKLYAV